MDESGNIDGIDVGNDDDGNDDDIVDGVIDIIDGGSEGSCVGDNSIGIDVNDDGDIDADGKGDDGGDDRGDDDGGDNVDVDGAVDDK